MTGRSAESFASIYEALSRKDLDAWLAFLAPDAELTEIAEVPDARVYRGHRGAREWAEGMLEVADEWRLSPEEVLLDEGDTAVIRVCITGRGTAGLPT